MSSGVRSVAVGAAVITLLMGVPTVTSTAQAPGVATKACPTQSGTRTEYLTVKNRLDLTVKITNDQIDCYDWSGASNPSKYSGAFTSGQVLNRARLELNKGYFRRVWRVTLTKPNGKELGRARMFMNWFACGQGYEVMALASTAQTKSNVGGWDGVVPLGTVGGRQTQLRLHTVTQNPGGGGKKACTTVSNELIVEYS